jgi:uncharacterized protein YecT (DUF1311 family)
MRNSSYLCLIALAVFVSPAYAELCDDPQKPADIDYCATYAFTKADGALNDVYGKLKTAYQTYPKSKAALVASQRAWVIFRDAECDQDKMAIDGGSVERQLLLQCKAQLTDLRTEQLQNRLLCKEGDLSCISLESDPN